jgi:hypothetical protein
MKYRRRSHPRGRRRFLLENMTVPNTIIHIDPVWRCPCGAPIKAFDFRIEPDEIAHECRCCHRRLLTIESASDTDQPAA